MGNSQTQPPPALSQWDDVRYFLAVVREGSFSRAARSLGADQSTVSRRIIALEAALRQPLFERGARAAVLTSYGAQLVESATAVELAVLSLSDAAHAGEVRVQGRVRLALTEGLAQLVVVPRVLPALFEAHPDLAVDLVTGDEAVDLTRHEADIALRFFRTPRGALVGQRVARLSLAPLVAKAHRKRFWGVTVGEIPWISYVRPGLRTPESRWLEAAGLPRARLECTSVETQLAAVRAGLGVALAPRAQTRAQPDLCVLEGLELPPLPTLDLYVVTRAAIRKLPRIAVVYDALVETLRSLDG